MAKDPNFIGLDPKFLGTERDVKPSRQSKSSRGFISDLKGFLNKHRFYRGDEFKDIQSFIQEHQFYNSPENVRNRPAPTQAPAIPDGQVHGKAGIDPEFAVESEFEGDPEFTTESEFAGDPEFGVDPLGLDRFPGIGAPGSFEEEPFTDPFEGLEDVKIGEKASVAFPGIDTRFMPMSELAKQNPFLFKTLHPELVDKAGNVDSAALGRIEFAGLQAYKAAGGDDQTKLDRLEALKQERNPQRQAPGKKGYRGIKTLDDLEDFEEELMRGMGGNPYQLDPMDAVTAFNKPQSIRAFFNHIFGSKVLYSDLGKLPKDAQDHWRQSLVQERAARFNAAKKDMGQKIQAFESAQKKAYRRFKFSQAEEATQAKSLEKTYTQLQKAQTAKRKAGQVTKMTEATGLSELRKSYIVKDAASGLLKDPQGNEKAEAASKLYTRLIHGARKLPAGRAMQDAKAILAFEIRKYNDKFAENESKATGKTLKHHQTKLQKEFKEAYGFIPNPKLRR